jgi:hypothetical protein
MTTSDLQRKIFHLFHLMTKHGILSSIETYRYKHILNHENYKPKGLLLDERCGAAVQLLTFVGSGSVLFLGKLAAVAISSRFWISKGQDFFHRRERVLHHSEPREFRNFSGTPFLRGFQSQLQSWQCSFKQSPFSFAELHLPIEQTAKHLQLTRMMRKRGTAARQSG